MSSHLAPVPGFTTEQSLGLRAVAKEAVETMYVQMAARPCGFDCRDMTEVRDTLYGEGNDDGIKVAVTKMETQIASLVWWYRGLVVAVVSSWIILLVAALD